MIGRQCFAFSFFFTVLCAAGVLVLGVEVDTAYFTGNQSPAFRLLGACIDDDPTDAWLGLRRPTLGE